MTVAAPPAPQAHAVQVWDALYRSLEKDLVTWAKRLEAGKPPLTPEEAQRLRSMVNGIQALLKADLETAQIAASVLSRGAEAARSSLLVTHAAIGPHALAAAEEVASFVGWQSVPNIRAVEAVVNMNVGQLTSDYVRLSTDQQIRLVTELSKGIATGRNTGDVAKALSRVLEDWSAAGQSRSMTIARTTLARAYDMSNAAMYGEASQQGLIKGWKWLAHGKNPCEVCKALDGRVFPSESDTYRHPNCTCTTVPVLTGEKATVDGAPSSLELVTSKSGWTSWRAR